MTSILLSGVLAIIFIIGLSGGVIIYRLGFCDSIDFSTKGQLSDLVKKPNDSTDFKDTLDKEFEMLMSYTGDEKPEYRDDFED